ncbi:SET and MYND domain-containing protein 3 [Mortierella polycephala]|uniref:SET and MYND domain-containing protein 3 n=1 Tax=Mortierella polycephala TaxID=41804 RepID=A0A9P6UBE7_9FUNG|nr:SET and MYND domain-containing protein 3 [Mortierella polycephala]
MDAALQSTTTSRQQLTSTTPVAPTLRSGNVNRTKRNYRTKKRDGDSQDEDEHDQSQDTGMNSNDSIQDSAPTIAGSSLPYVQSQNAQNLAEVYPGLARLSFLDQEQEQQLGEAGGSHDGASSPLGSKKPRRPLQQKPQPEPHLQGEAPSPYEDESVTTFEGPQSTSSSIPPTTSPSAVSSGAGSGSSLMEIKETGSVTKGRGLFSAATGILKPGTLIFRELGYCQVVNDASLSQVCSTCFKDTREEQGEDEKMSSDGISASGQKRLVRCAGCKVVWYCNKTCQIKDWKLHHQLECQGIQKSMTNPVMKDVWTKRAMDTTTVRALCRLVRRRERVKASMAYKAEHGKIDVVQKQVNEVYFSGLDQKEEVWLDEHGLAWIDQYLNTYEKERIEASVSTSSSKGALEDSSHLTKIMAVVMSCVTPKEDRYAFLMGASEPSIGAEGSTGTGGLNLLRKLTSYGFTMTNLETTTPVGLALYIQCIPFMNHSCVPNCIYTFKGSRVECRVVRDIEPGEEMTISYIDQIGTTQERQKQLKERYHFTCDCPLCRYFPANPLVQPDEAAFKKIVPNPSYGPSLDPKQGYVCSNTACTARSVLAIDDQLAIYNKVELTCKECGHITELTQETALENQEETERLVLGFVREMNGGLASHGFKANARKFELAKVKVPESTGENASKDESKPSATGGMKTVQEPSPRALQYFDDAYRNLTGVSASFSGQSAIYDNVQSLSKGEDSIRRCTLHHLVRQLEQAGFDEAVGHKNWVFALHRSLGLERILNDTYVGHHPLKAIQGYYTCKIANLLANLLLEESTIEIEESDHGSGDEDMVGNSDDEQDLQVLRDAVGGGQKSNAVVAAATSGTGSMQEQLLKGKRKEKDEAGEADGERRKKRLEKSENQRTQDESSRQLLQYLKSLIPKLEESSILQQFRVCWGKDGKLASRYRYQVDSLKQALHYAELPFATP